MFLLWGNVQEELNFTYFHLGDGNDGNWPKAMDLVQWDANIWIFIKKGQKMLNSKETQVCRVLKFLKWPNLLSPSYKVKWHDVWKRKQ
jgi:hypothetical protein